MFGGDPVGRGRRGLGRAGGAHLEEDFVGLEAMSGIPGLVGATPMQNVGAYGDGQLYQTVRTYDRKKHEIRTFAAADCGFSYLQLTLQDRSGPLRDLVGHLPTPARVDVEADSLPELARALGVEMNSRAPAGPFGGQC